MENNRPLTGRIFMKFDRSVFGKWVEKIQLPLKSGQNNGYFKCLIISLSVFLRMRNVSADSCRENQNTNFIQIKTPN